MESTTIGHEEFYNQTWSNYSGHIDLEGEVRISLYALIFFLSVVGNFLVILTLIQNKRMRTVTNVFLLNLAFSDLLLAVFCMPFTLIPVLLRNFIFGAAICVMIRYLQAVSVGVSCFTLVAISLERYFAICRPLKSRSWQTLSHSYKTIAFCWLLAAVVMIPISVYTKLKAFPLGNFGCREQWDSYESAVAYMVFLDLMLLVFPVLLMSLSYGMIVRTLWMGMRVDKDIEDDSNNGVCHNSDNDTETIALKNFVTAPEKYTTGNSSGSQRKSKRKYDYQRGIRQANSEKSRAAKKRVIKMLFAVVLEFFVCWTPLYAVQTWQTVHISSAVSTISPVAMSFIHLLSYVSSCTNPITYCFMNKKFRQAFVAAFRCCEDPFRRHRKHQSSYMSNTMSIKTDTCRVTVYDKDHDSDDCERL